MADPDPEVVKRLRSVWGEHYVRGTFTQLPSLTADVDALLDSWERVNVENAALTREAAKWHAKAGELNVLAERRGEALRAVALSPQWNCTGEHPHGCDCVGDMVREALEGQP